MMIKVDKQGIVFMNGFKKVSLKYSEIKSIELIEEDNSKTKSGAMGATVGTVLAGPVGTVIGGLARRGKKKERLGLSLDVLTVDGDFYSIVYLKPGSKPNKRLQDKARKDMKIIEHHINQG